MERGDEGTKGTIEIAFVTCRGARALDIRKELYIIVTRNDNFAHNVSSARTTSHRPLAVREEAASRNTRCALEHSHRHFHFPFHGLFDDTLPLSLLAPT